MDLLCQRCGEPWDACLDDLTEQEKADFHASRGCPCCRNKPDADIHLSPRQQEAVTVQTAMRDVLGDDIDGLAAEMEDFGFT